MKWTVVYLPACEQELADLWLDPASRAEIADAANRIDRLLQRDPQAGESRENEDERVLFVAPLGALYRVNDDDCLVEVVHVWKFS